MNFKKVLCGFVFSVFLLGGVNANAFTSSDNSEKVTVNSNYASELSSGSKNIENDAKTNLLKDRNDNSLEFVNHSGVNYDLKKIDITRYRQKVKIEYYLGDYNQSSLIGSDEGYADYDDAISDYVMNVQNINTKFNQSIPTTYKLVPYSSTDRSVYSYIPKYDGTDSVYTAKVLVAEVKRYGVSAKTFHNRQGVRNPSPVGLTSTELSASTDYWLLNTLSTNFNAVVGMEVNLKDVGQFRDTHTQGSRTGVLEHAGYHSGGAGAFVDGTTITVSSTTPTTLNIAATYEVDDYDSPQVKPGYSSSMTSGASVGFTGATPDWKNEKVVETMDLSNEANYEKIKAYPFDLADDPFDAPEHSLWWVPVNWALGHKLVLDYYYEKSSTQPINYYTVKFESNGGSKVADITKVSADSLITKPKDPTKKGYKFKGWYKGSSLKNAWNFSSDKVNSDLTLYAKWTKEAKTLLWEGGVPKTGTTLLLMAIGVLSLAAVVYGCKNKYLK